MPGHDAFEMNDIASDPSGSSSPIVTSVATHSHSHNHHATAGASAVTPGRAESTTRRRSNTANGSGLRNGYRYAKDEASVQAERGFWTKICINSGLIALWFLFSISITVYNKWMFNGEDGEGGEEHKAELVFPFPLFTTCVHMLVQFGLASLVLYLVPSLRPSLDFVNPHAPAGTRHELRDPSEPLMTRRFYLTRIGPCGAATGLDIGLGNMSFKFITLTFYTMCKSSVLAFVLLFAFLFRLEKPSWRLAGIIGMMTIGVVMMVAGEAAFNLIGFLLIMTASACSGFRWSLTQVLLIRHPATSNPFSSIFYLAPVMFTTLFFIAVPVEGFRDLLKALGTLVQARGAIGAVAILLFPGCLAFCMTASEFALLQRTSVVTLSICGIFKEVLTISVASFWFHDQLTPINGIGLALTICTIAAYNYMKIQAMRDEANGGSGYESGYAPVIAEEDDEIADIESLSGRVKDDDSSIISNSGLLQATPSAKKAAKSRPQRLGPGSLAVSSRGLDSPTRTSPMKRPEDIE